MDKNQIVVVGSCMMDFVSYAPNLPKKGETIHGSKFVTAFGGKGANQCVAAAKLGANTKLIARVGEDIWGEKYIENLLQQNVDIKHIKKTKNFTSGIAQINVSDLGDNQIVIISGANSQLSIKDLEIAKEDIENAAVLICQLETSWEVALAALKLCKGVSILNGAPALKEFNNKLLTLPTIFCVNESEASTFTQLPVNNIEEANKATTKLIELGCKSVILTLGSEGALYMSKEMTSSNHIKSSIVKCIDSTGAGDAFIGALAYLIAHKKELPIAKQIEIACIVAADSVTRPGTQISFPGPEILQSHDS